MQGRTHVACDTQTNAVRRARQYTEAALTAQSVMGQVGLEIALGALNRDYTLVMGVVILYSTLIILMNLLADLILAYLDPKVRVR